MDSNITSYKEFWLGYLKEHSHPGNRAMHYISTAIITYLFCGGIYLGNWLMVILVPFVGYGITWFGHLYIEKNKPATWQYPVWSYVSDYRMFIAFLTGRLEKDLKKIVLKKSSLKIYNENTINFFHFIDILILLTDNSGSILWVFSIQLI